MYWVYLVIFIFAVLSPDIIRGDIYFLPERRAEELLIFVLGVFGFLLFTWIDRQLFIQRREKDRDKKQIKQTTKDLVDSYSYIGEVNRKMDILMNISLGLTDKSNLSKNKQAEIYHAILEAAKFLMRAECVILKFINLKDGSLAKEMRLNNSSCNLKNQQIAKIDESSKFESISGFLITSSHNKIKNIKSFLIFSEYDNQDEKTMDMLRVLASQALFVYSYAGHIAD